jgi:hypothetical protein
MSPAVLLQKLREIGCELRPEGDRLRVRAPAGVLTDELRSLIREHKAELLRLLSAGSRGQEEARPSPASGIALALSLQDDGTCYCCKGSRWWLSRYGVLMCATCHPPAALELVARWVDREEAARLAHA